MKDLELIITRIIFTLILLAFAVLMIFLTFSVLDGLTIEQTGIEKVKCLDKEGREFEDEWCEEETYCTKYGFLNGIKCSEVKK